MIFLLDEKDHLVYGNKSFHQKFQKGGEEKILNNIIGKGKLIEEQNLQKVKKTGHWSGESQHKKEQGIQYYYVRMERLNYKEQNYYSVILNDISHFKKSEIDIEYFKYYDTLTKAKNSVYFWEQGQETFLKKIKEGNAPGLLMININKFREINEVKGYAFGNKILIAFSERLQKLKEIKSILVRMGNDEFVILLWNIKDFEGFYNKLLNFYEALKKPYIIRKEEIFLNISIGISIYPNDGKDLSKLYKAGAMALGKLKNEGRSGFEFYDHELNKDAVKKYDMKVLLRKAIKEEGFTLHYQPQICLKEKKIIGIEALIRLIDGDAIIMPGEFIGIAEGSGLIKPIGEWVLKTACDFSNRLYQKGYEIPVSVNISRQQFEKAYIVPQIRRVLRETKLPANLLQIEITEGMLMENTQECIEIISTLKEIGITISIDDFGTGYSSLEYLKKFDVDQLKIDRAFIKDVPHKDNGVIAKVVVELAESFGMDAIAEGIEKQVQEDFLVEIGCKGGQGFYYYKPMKGETLEALLSSMYNEKIVGKENFYEK